MSVVLTNSTTNEITEEEITPQFRTPSNQPSELKSSSQTHTTKQRRLEQVTPNLRNINESSSEGNRKQLIQVSNKQILQQIKILSLTKTTAERCRFKLSVWDTGGQTIRRVSWLSLGPTTKKGNKPTPYEPIIQELPALQEELDD